MKITFPLVHFLLSTSTLIAGHSLYAEPIDFTAERNIWSERCTHRCAFDFFDGQGRGFLEIEGRDAIFDITEAAGWNPSYCNVNPGFNEISTTVEIVFSCERTEECGGYTDGDLMSKILRLPRKCGIIGFGLIKSIAVEDSGSGRTFKAQVTSDLSGYSNSQVRFIAGGFRTAEEDTHQSYNKRDERVLSLRVLDFSLSEVLKTCPNLQPGHYLRWNEPIQVFKGRPACDNDQACEEGSVEVTPKVDVRARVGIVIAGFLSPMEITEMRAFSVLNGRVGAKVDAFLNVQGGFNSKEISLLGVGLPHLTWNNWISVKPSLELLARVNGDLKMRGKLAYKFKYTLRDDELSFPKRKGDTFKPKFRPSKVNVNIDRSVHPEGFIETHVIPRVKFNIRVAGMLEASIFIDADSSVRAGFEHDHEHGHSRATRFTDAAAISHAQGKHTMFRDIVGADTGNVAPVAVPTPAPVPIPAPAAVPVPAPAPAQAPPAPPPAMNNLKKRCAGGCSCEAHTGLSGVFSNLGGGQQPTDDCGCGGYTALSSVFSNSGYQQCPDLEDCGCDIYAGRGLWPLFSNSWDQLWSSFNPFISTEISSCSCGEQRPHMCMGGFWAPPRHGHNFLHRFSANDWYGLRHGHPNHHSHHGRHGHREHHCHHRHHEHDGRREHYGHHERYRYRDHYRHREDDGHGEYHGHQYRNYRSAHRHNDKCEGESNCGSPFNFFASIDVRAGALIKHGRVSPVVLDACGLLQGNQEIWSIRQLGWELLTIWLGHRSSYENDESWQANQHEMNIPSISPGGLPPGSNPILDNRPQVGNHQQSEPIGLFLAFGDVCRCAAPVTSGVLEQFWDITSPRKVVDLYQMVAFPKQAWN